MRGLPIGQLLLQKNLISVSDLKHALAEQRETRSKIGQVLIGQGSVTAYRFYQALAEQRGCPFIDLRRHPPDPALLDPEDCAAYLQVGVLPWRKQGEEMILAVQEITPEVRRWAATRYGSRFLLALAVPQDVHHALQKAFPETYHKAAVHRLWQRDPLLSARNVFAWQTVALLGLLVLGAAAILWGNGWTGIFIAANVFFALTLAFKLLFFVTGKVHRAECLAKPSVLTLPDNALPVYTLLIPLFHETHTTIRTLTQAVRDLQYPKAKLDVKLIVEEDDAGTIEVIKQLTPESYFEIVRVPYSLPRTKPKACNYALQFARGDYVTIYDAEDIPDPRQLRKALAMFQHGPEHLACVQAKLNYYNARENLLTCLFALEYAAWFEYMLYGLQALSIPIPLGGTSNHFPTRILQALCAWDPFNVTEDADLGLRLAQKGYTTRVMDSTTLEEAPTHVGPWLRQRSRWIKGHLQTYLVHMRRPVQLYRQTGLSGLLGFQFFVGAPCLVYLLTPFLLLVTVLAAWLGDWVLHAPVLYFAYVCFAYGLLLHAYFALEVIVTLRWWHLLPFALCFPFYWVMHSLASFRAVWQLITRPHYWEKTMHGHSQVLQE
ncbi:MAG: glycosyltransferase [Hyphomicrobiales bacterium]|nr:glycosyltransferase [Hyphomicrobiales bacterium]